MLTIKRMDRLIALQQKNAEHDFTGVLAALKTVKQCAESEIGGGSCDWSAWSAEDLAAWPAAWSVAWPAEDLAAWSAEAAAYQQERDDLLECLKSL